VVATLPRWNELPDKHAELCELRASARSKILHQWRRGFVRAMLLDEVSDFEINEAAIDEQVDYVLQRYYARMNAAPDDIAARLIVKQTFMSERQAAAANERRLKKRAEYERKRVDRNLIAKGLQPKRRRAEAANDDADADAEGSEQNASTPPAAQQE
jgi:hypothetical protein